MPEDEERAKILELFDTKLVENVDEMLLTLYVDDEFTSKINKHGKLVPFIVDIKRDIC